MFKVYVTLSDGQGSYWSECCGAYEDLEVANSVCYELQSMGMNASVRLER